MQKTLEGCGCQKLCLLEHTARIFWDHDYQDFGHLQAWGLNPGKSLPQGSFCVLSSGTAAAFVNLCNDESYRGPAGISTAQKQEASICS